MRLAVRGMEPRGPTAPRTAGAASEWGSNGLSCDVLQTIFGKLGDAAAVASVRRVCRQWRDVGGAFLRSPAAVIEGQGGATEDRLVRLLNPSLLFVSSPFSMGREEKRSVRACALVGAFMTIFRSRENILARGRGLF